MSTGQALVTLLVVLIIGVVVLLHKEFSTADAKIKAVFDATDAEVREREYKNLLFTLNIYIGYHTWTQLTTAQKELLADVIDEEHGRINVEDRIVGTDSAFQPVERWWR